MERYNSCYRISPMGKLPVKSSHFPTLLVTTFGCLFVLIPINFQLGWSNTQTLRLKDGHPYRAFTEVLSLADGSVSHEVYVFSKDEKATNPPILLLHELPGLSDETLKYAKTLSNDFTVYVPLLFGALGQESTLKGWAAYSFNGEWWRRDSLDGSRLIAHWLRYVVSQIAQRHTNQQIGIIGMCLTGALPLALLDNPHVHAIVVAQPSLPLLNWSADDRQSFDISPREWEAAQRRVKESGNVRVYGVRFEKDCIAKREKYLRLRTAFKKNFIDAEIEEEEYRFEKDNGETEIIADDAHSTLIREWGVDTKHPSENRRREVRLFLMNPFSFKRIPSLEAGSN